MAVTGWASGTPYREEPPLRRGVWLAGLVDEAGRSGVWPLCAGPVPGCGTLAQTLSDTLAQTLGRTLP